MKFKRSLLSSALLLASMHVFADASQPLVPYGSGVYFYAWTANDNCSTDTSINPTGSCPEKWTDTVKNINAQVPASADKAQIKYIYLDSITFNWSHNDVPVPKTIFTVGGCNDTADITFCVNSGGLTYANPQKLDGPTAVNQLATELGMPTSTYYIMPMISDARNEGLMNMIPGQLQSLAFSLACIVNPQAAVPTWATGFTGGPTSCKDVFTGRLNGYSSSSAQNISGLAFDVENPDFSGRHYVQANGTPGPIDQNSASDFYSTLQKSIGVMTPAKYIMFSRGPGGLLETNDGQQASANLPTFGEVAEKLNTSNQGPLLIFSPQIYDLCDGMGNTTTSWACPLSTPFDYGYESRPTVSINLPAPYNVDDGGNPKPPIWGAAYNNFQFFQAIPNSPMPGSLPAAETGVNSSHGTVPLSWLLLFPNSHDTGNGAGYYNNPLDDLPIKSMSMAYLFKSELEGKSFSQATINTVQFPHSVENNGNQNPISPPHVPVQLTISGGASSQIWEHVNLYNVDPGSITPNPILPNEISPATPYSTVDYYRYPTQFSTDFDVVSQQDPTGVMNIPFTPSMIYTNKQLCQYENPNGSSGATIPNCISYKNPYGETVAAYADAFFTTLQYALANDSSANQTTAPFYGVAMYPFTPYGFFDASCNPTLPDGSTPNPNYNKYCKAGFFPEVPDGLVNGQKPETSFWKIYVGKFGNQWTGASTGTIPTPQANTDTDSSGSLSTSETLITLPLTGYYSNNGGTATVNFSVQAYPQGSINANISSYRARLIDGTGAVVASSDPNDPAFPNNSNSGSCTNTSCTMSNVPGGNYTLEVQALASNGGVITEVDAAAMGPAAQPALSSQLTISNLQVVGTPTVNSYTLSWTLDCTTAPSSGFSAVSQLYAQGNNSPLSRSSVWIDTPTCGQTYQSRYTPSKGSLSTTVKADLVLEQSGTFQYLTQPSYIPITFPASKP